MTESANVLIVDDDADVRSIIHRALSRQGFKCSSAANAEEALASVDAGCPSLTITDIQMPGRDGISLLTELKSRWPELAVIMLTGMDDARTAVDCLKKGAEDYLTKPIDLDELQISAKRAIDRARLIQENQEYRRNLDRKVSERTDQLHRALKVIENTYHSTLESLVSLPRVDQGTYPEKLAGPRRQDDAASVVRLAVQDQPAHLEAVGAAPAVEQRDSVEMATLHLAAELIGQGASALDIATAMATQLVDGGGAPLAQFWLPSKETNRLQMVVERGTERVQAFALAQKAASTHVTEVEQWGNGRLVSVPVLVRGRAEAVLQVGWMDETGPERVSLTERLALFLAASLVREQEAEQSRKAALELDLFREIAGAGRYSLDLEHVAQFIIDSLHKIVDYDVAGLLLLDEPASLDIQTRAPISEALLAWVRTHILNTLRLTCGVEAEDGLNARVRGVETLEESPRGTPDKLRSFVNVPLTVGGSVVGLVHVSSHRENAFDQDDIAFLNRAADFMASSVQGVRDALAIVKGRIERMVEHMTDGVLMLDRHGDVVAMNGAARAILGMDPQSRKHVRAAELARVLELDAMDLMRAERRTLRKELWLHGVPYQTQLSPIEETVGGLAGAVMAFRNFTEEKQIDEMKSEFINIVSHELRTPLTAIKNAVHLVLGSRLGELNSNQKRFLEMAQRNIDDLVALINDLLDLSKIEAGRMQIPLRPLELSQPIEKSVSSLGPQATEKGIALETTIGSDLPSLYGDAASIQRVVVNLVGNALKFTDRGGRVRVEATSTWEEAGGERRRAVQVTISDTGSGIPKEQLESIFDKFHQVDGSRSQQVAGTGLGLPITRELIKAHHGRIWAESEPGSGSIFSFVIPALTRDQLFFSGLDRDLERARRLTLALALVVVRLFDADRLAGGLGEERYQALLDSVEACAQKAIRRSTDRVELRREKAVLVVVLPDVLREGGKAFTTRLLEEIKATTAGDHVGLGCAFSMFPEQATTAERLYQVAFERTEAKATLTRSESSS